MIALVCEPAHLRIEEPINAFQREALSDPPRAAEARRQHAGLVSALRRCGVEVLAVSPMPEAPYQVFTRDVLVGGLGVPILATLREPLRRPELAAVRETLERAGITYAESEGGVLEGGDVVVLGREVWVGLGDRTERAGAEWLTRHCGDAFEVHVLQVKPGFLHLDMVFSVLDGERCVVFPDAFEAGSWRRIRSRFPDRLEIGAREQRARSTNFLPLEESAAIASTTISKSVRDAIVSSGRQLHLVELGEIQKAGGSVRCATCLV